MIQPPMAKHDRHVLQPEIVPEVGFDVFLDDDFPDGLTRRDHREHVLGERDDDIEDIRLLRIQHALQRGAQFTLARDAFGGHVEALDRKSVV